MAEFRDLLFGDVPMHEWAASGHGEPWVSFRTGDEAALRGILAMPGLESRHYAEAWFGLRGLGVTPDRDELYGVVIDVPVADGLDTLAAYADGSARYLNAGGGAVVWDTADDSVTPRVHAVIAAGVPVLGRAGPWEGPRPPLGAGNTRLSLITPRGLSFGEGPFDTLAADALAGPVLVAGLDLMRVLTLR